MSDLEKKFAEIQEHFIKMIQKHLDSAMEQVEMAEKLADEHGIPFHSYISPVSQTYFPETVKCKLRDLFPNPYPVGSKDHEKHDSELEELIYYKTNCGYYGWEHSAVC